MKTLLILKREEFRRLRGGLIVTRWPTRCYYTDDPIEIALTFSPPKKIEGRIVDEKGNPIAGLKLRISNCDYVDQTGKSTAYEEFYGIGLAAAFMPEQMLAVTNKQGRFEFSSVPPDLVCSLLLGPHPHYGDVELYTTTAQNPPEKYDDQPVLRLPLQLTLQSARMITVEVRSDQNDQPVAGVSILGYQRLSISASSEGTSDKDGKVKLKLPPGKYRLVGDAPRESTFVRTYQDLMVNKTSSAQNVLFRQQSGCVLTLKAIDAETGKGIPWVRFTCESEVGRLAPDARTNDRGELVALVYPGKRTYRVGPEILAVGYKLADRDDLGGRELELPAGKTVTATFKLRRK